MISNLKTINRFLSRPLHIQQASESIFSGTPAKQSNGESSILEKSSDVISDILPSARACDRILLKALGEPSTLVAITSPPSVSTFVRIGSLLLAQGEKISKIKTLNPIKTLLLDGQIQFYEELVSTEPRTYLISSRRRTVLSRVLQRTNRETFATLNLDGKQDWAVLRRDALQAYGGPSVTVTKHKYPRLISRSFARELGFLKRVPTGLSSIFDRGFTFIGGRGVAAIIGNGLTFALALDTSEYVVVDRQAVLSISVNGPLDLQNCIVEAKSTKAEGTKQSKSPRASEKSSPGQIKFQRFRIMISNIIFSGIRLIMNVVFQRNGMIKILGPRTVLLQSDRTGHTYKLNDDLFLKGEREFKTLKDTRSPADYLNTVTFHPDKKLSIKSTSTLLNKNS